MHLKTRDIAMAGVLMALSVLCIVLGGIVEFSTLTLLLLAAFLSGAVICDMGLMIGAMYIAGTFILGFLIGSQKMYAFTYLGFSLYIFLVEAAYRQQLKLMVKKDDGNQRKWNVIIWIYKFFIFNIIYIPCLVFMPQVFLGTGFSDAMVVGIGFAGQPLWVLADVAYNTFIFKIWKPFRKRLLP